MTEKEQTIETYNNNARAMAQDFLSIGARVADVKKGFSLVLKENPFVVEIGCGNGREAKEILKQTNNYLGIDISPEMIKLAQEYAPEAQFEIADLESYDFPAGTDIIFSFASLLHSDEKNVRAVLKKAHGALNPGGIFFISLKSGSGKETRTDKFGTRTFYYYTPKIIRDLAGDSFRVVEEDEQTFRNRKWFTIILQKN